MINNINLVAPEIYLEQNAAGQANWEFSKPADGETAAVKAAEAELPQAAERVKTAEKAVFPTRRPSRRLICRLTALIFPPTGWMLR